MKLPGLIALVFFILISCREKKMTLEELHKAKWTNLVQGVDYISTQKSDGATEKDSFVLTLRGIQEGGLLVEAFMNNEYIDMPGLLSVTLKEQGIRSKAGYLKVNLEEMIKPLSLTGKIYLAGDYTDPFSFPKDSATLVNIPGIRSATFISKDSAMKIYLAEGNNDWSQVLDENPLPNAIEVRLENKEWTKELLGELESAITTRVTMASEFSYPGLLFEKSDKYFLFEYKKL